MRYFIFLISFAAMLGLGTEGLHAQVACAPRPIAVIPKGSGIEQMAAHKLNFTNAVVAENVHYAETHRSKLVSFMERVTQKDHTGTAPANGAPGAAPAVAPQTQKPATGLDRQKEIIAVFKALKIQDASGIALAKSKLGLIDEFEVIMKEKSAPTN